jgi:hypothetical protein
MLPASVLKKYLQTGIIIKLTFTGGAVIQMKTKKFGLQPCSNPYLTASAAFGERLATYYKMPAQAQA